MRRELEKKPALGWDDEELYWVDDEDMDDEEEFEEEIEEEIEDVPSEDGEEWEEIEEGGDEGGDEFEEKFDDEFDEEWEDDEWEDWDEEELDIVEDDDYKFLTEGRVDEYSIQKSVLAGDLKASDLESFLSNNYLGDSPVLIKISHEGKEITAFLNSIMFSNNTLILKGDSVGETV